MKSSVLLRYAVGSQSLLLNTSLVEHQPGSVQAKTLTCFLVSSQKIPRPSITLTSMQNAPSNNLDQQLSKLGATDSGFMYSKPSQNKRAHPSNSHGRQAAVS